MSREYLEEDLQLISKYFPGAKPVVLRTPFDLSAPEDPWRLRSDNYSEATDANWYGDLSWNRS